MKTIKSVKLANDFNNGVRKVSKEVLGVETYGSLSHYGNNYKFDDGSNIVSFAKGEVIDNKTGLFQIEYEDEGFEWNKRIYSYNEIRDFLNALADWCDAKFPEKIDGWYNIYLCNEALNTTKLFYSYDIGIKLNNIKSTNLFLSELNRPEFATYKAEYIKMLKSNRL
jgi:hypothetical protein